jgi:hypothetical protein
MSNFTRANGPLEHDHVGVDLVNETVGAVVGAVSEPPGEGAGADHVGALVGEDPGGLDHAVEPAGVVAGGV